MKWIFCFLPILIIACPSCETRKREVALQKKEAELKQKEQELLLKERTLELKEEELLKREQQIDSASINNTTPIDTSLTGTWSVKMTCTNTSCPGYAVGDTKSETWQMSYEGTTIIVRVMSNDQLVRVYTGTHINNTIELVEDKSAPPQGTRNQMIVRLRSIDANRLEGQREIVRDDCKVTYSLQLEKERRGK
jgi:hypothetical protein